MQDQAVRERNANDPAHMALVEDMKKRIMGLCQSMEYERQQREALAPESRGDYVPATTKVNDANR
jgi:hypothetical protein